MASAEPGRSPRATLFDLRLPPLPLEAGGEVAPHVVRGFHLGPPDDSEQLARVVPPLSPEASVAWQVVRRSQAQLAGAPAAARGARLSPELPTVLVVHALTGDARAGGPGGWWEPVIGPGQPLDPQKQRILCFNLLGSCYGSSGPCDQGFPRLLDQGLPAPAVPARGHRTAPEPTLPAVVTSWDQARSILGALDALGVDQVALCTGGSLGGMVALALAALEPRRFQRLLPIAASDAASPWILAFNHVARQVLLADPGWPERPERGLELARQLAMITYRAEAGFEATQGRRMAAVADGDAPAWAPRGAYRMQTWLEHQGAKLRARFDPHAYLCLLGAMDHHDLGRPPPGAPPATAAASWGLARIRASTLAVSVDSDQLYLPAQIERWAHTLAGGGAHLERAELRSAHGHDAFLIEWPQLRAVLQRGMDLPAAG